mmetsp:Transcript_25314/g.52600  ORF Transcript_25314/g.52600 Transcript_25314/m.52600 type:complete len:241 (-) Transcript_25314:119-841(-)
MSSSPGPMSSIRVKPRLMSVAAPGFSTPRLIEELDTAPTAGTTFATTCRRLPRQAALTSKVMLVNSPIPKSGRVRLLEPLMMMLATFVSLIVSVASMRRRSLWNLPSSTNSLCHVAVKAGAKRLLPSCPFKVTWLWRLPAPMLGPSKLVKLSRILSPETRGHVVLRVKVISEGPDAIVGENSKLLSYTPTPWTYSMWFSLIGAAVALEWNLMVWVFSTTPFIGMYMAFLSSISTVMRCLA